MVHQSCWLFFVILVALLVCTRRIIRRSRTKL